MNAHCDYDLIIIGGGPAGLTAGLYASRAKLSTAIIEKSTPGGRIANTELVENFPGFPQGISGSELSARMMSQLMQAGVAFIRTETTGVELRDELKYVNTAQGDYSAQALIIAGGCQPRKLGVPGEDELVGSGVSYCAFCDGNRFAGQPVAIIGGGDGGITEGLYMSRIASKVTIIEILPRLGAAKILQERARENPRMDILCSTKVETITTEGNMRVLRLKNTETGEKSSLEVSGIFVLIGLVPATAYLKGLVELDDDGFIKVKGNLETSVPGIFAAGDIRSGSSRQAIAAAGDGATAALSAEKFITFKQRL
ncbi:MAG: FAD-binding protein [Chloroflexi bacterium]|nr:FAD-binding protein [Chloroflexota bacterium]